MSAAAIGGVSAATSSKVPNQLSQLSSDDFLKVLLSELSNQDPLEPSDTSAILEQLSSLRNIESQISLQERLENLVLQNGVSAASNMIGKTVQGLDEDNNAVEGLVTSVRISDDKAYLELDSGHTLPVDRVTRIEQLNR